MYAMPIIVAQQLVSDRRARYEAVAGQHRLRRLVSRRSAVDNARPVPQPRPATISLVECPEVGNLVGQVVGHDESIALDDVRTVA